MSHISRRIFVVCLMFVFMHMCVCVYVQLRNSTRRLGTSDFLYYMGFRDQTLVVSLGSEQHLYLLGRLVCPVGGCFLINYSKNLVNIHFSALNMKAYYYLLSHISIIFKVK